MRLDWRTISGPVLATATTLIALFLDRHLTIVPDPAPLFICIVALAGSLSGIRSATITAAIAITGAALFFFGHRTTPDYAPTELIRLALLAVTAGGTAAITGLLRQRVMNSFAQERQHHATAERLSAALDQVDFGIVLLSADTRAEFTNRAFREYFSLPEAKTANKPPFIALMYHGRDTGAYELPADELNAFVARRMQMVRAGDATPINIKLRDGKVLRFRCTALPDGGRMLSYTPLGDPVRHTDDPADAEYLRSLRDSSDRRFARHLRAAE